MTAERSAEPPAATARQVPLLNVANALTVLRIVLVPVFLVFTATSEMTHAGWRIAAGIAFSVASLTDFIDGWIARTWDMVTPFGKVADPIADKALIGTAVVLLSAYGRLSWWLTATILIREIGVTVLRFWVIHREVIPASRGGKAKTALQTLAITWYLLPLPDGVARIGVWIMWLAVAVTVVTGMDYVLRVFRLRRSTG